MKRLTTEFGIDYIPAALCERIGGENLGYNGCSKHCEEVGGNCEDGGCIIQKCFNKLGQYEDLEEQGKLLKRPCKANRKDRKEIMAVIGFLWAATDQVQIMDLVNFAFDACPYETQKEILERLYDYGTDAYNDKRINPGFEEAEFCEFLERAEKILER